MSKRCPPGVICIENITIVIIILILGGVLLFIHIKNNNTIKETVVRESGPYLQSGGALSLPGAFSLPGALSLPDDILRNPYDAPLRDDRYIQGRGGGIPINIPTQSIDTNYRQVGILTRVHGKETILPLMGRPLMSNRDKWNFYTMNDKNNMIKLPITFKGRSCTNEYGCDNLYNGDTVYVEGYNDAFKVTAYDNQVMRYIPFM